MPQNRIATSARFVAVLLAASLVCSLLPSLAWATHEDQTDTATEEQIRGALASGEIKTDPGTEDSPNAFSMRSSSSYAVQTISGTTLYDTAAAQALRAYPGGASMVIVASGESYVDALAATSLAGALDCPMLLTQADSLPQATSDALGSLQPSSIIVVGGRAVVSDGVVRALENQYGTVERLAGATQYDTQLQVYARGAGLWSTEKIYVASGSMVTGRFADALSLSPAAVKQAVPIFLVDDNGNLTDAAAQVLAAQSSAMGAVVAGGKAVVSEQTCGFLEALTMRNGGSRNVVRLSGETAYGTSAAVAQWATEQGILSWQNAAVTTAQLPYDALAGSVLQGKDGAVLLLADSSNADNMSLLSQQGVSSYRYFGGSYWFSNRFKAQQALSAGIGLSSIEGFLLYLDVGHGWSSSNDNAFDYGASGCGYNEYDLNNELAHKVADILRNSYGMDVYVNDDGGYYAYRQAEAAAMNCGALVSIHFNAGGGSGTESYIHSYNAAAGSSILQQRVHHRLVQGTGLTDRGMKTAQLAVCSGSVPATLLEIAFIDNSYDMSAYRSRIDVVAQSIASGIAE